MGSGAWAGLRHPPSAPHSLSQYPQLWDTAKNPFFPSCRIPQVVLGTVGGERRAGMAPALAPLGWETLQGRGVSHLGWGVSRVALYFHTCTSLFLGISTRVLARVCPRRSPEHRGGGHSWRSPGRAPFGALWPRLPPSAGAPGPGAAVVLIVMGSVMRRRAEFSSGSSKINEEKTAGQELGPPRGGGGTM